VSFMHFRTWTFGKAVPACAPGITPSEKVKQAKYKTVTSRAKTTCPHCKIRMGWLKPEDYLPEDEAKAQQQEADLIWDSMSPDEQREALRIMAADEAK
jgi:hypothetical protein